MIAWVQTVYELAPNVKRYVCRRPELRIRVRNHGTLPILKLCYEGQYCFPFTSIQDFNR